MRGCEPDVVSQWGSTADMFQSKNEEIRQRHIRTEYQIPNCPADRIYVTLNRSE